ncbi:hypothetical protein [Streptomyces sp. NPDC059455]|uniref:hypothetical protein n=1 Tax=Streptomyces sp. NPDC059455 TaxID=3346837 RepID=UPI0036914C5B
MIKETSDERDHRGHRGVEAPVVESAAEAVSDEQLVAMLVDRARNDGLQLTGALIEHHQESVPEDIAARLTEVFVSSVGVGRLGG